MNSAQSGSAARTWPKIKLGADSLESRSPFDDTACLTAVEELIIMLTSADNRHTVRAFFEGVCPYIVYIFAKSVTMAMSSRSYV